MASFSSLFLALSAILITSYSSCITSIPAGGATLANAEATGQGDQPFQVCVPVGSFAGDTFDFTITINVARINTNWESDLVFAIGTDNLYFGGIVQYDNSLNIYGTPGSLFVTPQNGESLIDTTSLLTQSGTSPKDPRMFLLDPNGEGKFEKLADKSDPGFTNTHAIGVDFEIRIIGNRLDDTTDVIFTKSISDASISFDSTFSESDIITVFLDPDTVGYEQFKINSIDILQMNCYTKKGSKSGTADDALSSAKCDPGFLLTSCGIETFWKKIDGSFIDSDTCYARNGLGGQGVWAVARCCDFGNGVNQCNNQKSIKSGTGDDNIISEECDGRSRLTGCTSSTAWQNMDGACPGKVPCWEANDGSYNVKPATDTCNAVNGWKGNGVWAEAQCCLPNIGYDIGCIQQWGSKSGTGDDDTSEVVCPFGYTLTGCSGYTPWKEMDGWFIENEKCIARNGWKGNGVWAVAICCHIAWAPIPSLPAKKVINSKLNNNNNNNNGKYISIKIDENYLLFLFAFIILLFLITKIIKYLFCSNNIKETKYATIDFEANK